MKDSLDLGVQFTQLAVGVTAGAALFLLGMNQWVIYFVGPGIGLAGGLGLANAFRHFWNRGARSGAERH